MLPLLLIGLLIYRSRDLLMREHIFAQVIPGRGGQRAATARHTFILLNIGVAAVAGLEIALAMDRDGGSGGGDAGLL